MMEHVGSWMLTTLEGVGMVIIRAPDGAMMIIGAARMMTGEL